MPHTDTHRLTHQTHTHLNTKVNPEGTAHIHYRGVQKGQCYSVPSTRSFGEFPVNVYTVGEGWINEECMILMKSDTAGGVLLMVGESADEKNAEERQ